MKLPSIFYKIKDLLTSPLRIGALEVSSTSIKYLVVRGNSIVQASLRLPPGVVERGTIKNRELFVAALKNLHAQITNKVGLINVVLTVPSQLVFAQLFTVPLVASENLEESIRLNLQMTSPNKIEESYYDYQEIKLNKDLGHLDLLGAFTSISAIDIYQKALEEAGFMPVSIEFPGLSLARLIRQRWGGIDLEQRYLLIYLNAEGLLLIILKNGNLAFNRFIPWQGAGDTGAMEGIDFPKAQEIIKNEIQRVINFYFSRTGKTIEEVILVSPVFNYEIVKLASEGLKLKVRNLTITELPKLQPNWFPALGAALRGLTSRSKDTDISLAAAGSQAEYYQERVLNFIALWRNIVFGTLVLAIAAFSMIATVFAGEQQRLEERLSAGLNPADVKDGLMVQEKIAVFNALLEQVGQTAEKEVEWSPVMRLVLGIAGSDILLDRVFIGKSDLRGIISGHAGNADAVLSFKEKLAAHPNVSSIELPLSNIKAETDRTASFSMTVIFKSLPTAE